MRLPRALLLLAAATSATMAFMATSAFAQSVEVLDEQTDLHCDEVTEAGSGHDIDGGCEVHMTSQSNIVTSGHVPGAGEIVTSSCQNVLVANIGEAGTGYIDVDLNTIIESEATGCGLEPCDEAEGGTTPHADLEWPIAGIAEYGESREALIVTLCLRNHAHPEGTGNRACTVVVDISQEIPGGHVYELRATDEPCLESGGLEITGHWVTNSLEDEIELVHSHWPSDNP